MGKGKKNNVQTDPDKGDVASGEGQAVAPLPEKGAWKKDKLKKKGKAGSSDTPAESQPGTSSQTIVETPQEPVSVQKSSSLASNVSKLSISEINYPVRESVTSSGKFPTEQLSTNFLEMNLKNLPDVIYHYDITFEPDRPKKFIIPAFHQLIQTHLKQLLNKVAFDGVKNFYSMKKIKDQDFPPICVASPDGTGREKEFKISIKAAKGGGDVDMSVVKTGASQENNQKAIQILNIIIGSAFDQDGLIRYKNSVFVPPNPNERKLLEGNYELFIGLFQSFVIGSRPFLNVDVSHKAFPSETKDLVALYESSQDKWDPQKFERMLDGLNLVYTSPMTHERKTFKYVGVRNSPKQEKFKDDKTGTMKTIESYFQENGIRIRFPNHPCIQVGSWDKNIRIPLEFLSIPPGQALNRQAPESCKPKMVKEAAKSTIERKNKIMSLVKEINYSGVQTIKQFGIVIGESFIQVNSHILKAPILEYANKRCIQITQLGQWRADKEKFLIPNSCTNWGVLVLDLKLYNEHRGKIMDFASGIPSTARKLGLNFTDFNINNLATGPLKTNADYDNVMNWFKEREVELIFVIISPKFDHYENVKKSAELRCGMLTQCVKSGTVQRFNGQILNNIMLKVNAKLGGTNHKIHKDSAVSINRRPFMVVGADVTHASPGQSEIPSVVGVAASYDQFGFRYNCQWRIQPKMYRNKERRQIEIILELETMMEEHLRVFKEKWNRLPAHILYYRDGVSEGQFAQVKETELTAIRKACTTMGDPDIKITVIIVQKRHHTRFFPDPNKQNPFDKFNNVTPGTVVDSEIIDPQKWQFYMVPHISMQGVAKPTKYCVIQDDANVDNQELQTFTYNLCHMFTRCNRTVSYVAPTYYAHLVAARGRVYIHKEQINMDQLTRENEKRNGTKIPIERPMFFV